MPKSKTTEPSSSRVINDYRTKNLNKAAFLLIRGATFKECRVLEPNRFGQFILDNVNMRHRDEFWDDHVNVELWTFLRMRNWLKSKLKETSTE